MSMRAVLLVWSLGVLLEVCIVRAVAAPLPKQSASLPAAPPQKTLDSDVMVENDLRRPDSIAQLIVNLSTALKEDKLLQPAILSDGPLTKLLGVAPQKWYDRTVKGHGTATRVRDGFATATAKGVPPLSARFHQEITTSIGKPFVPEGQAPMEQKVSTSITVWLGFSPAPPCVCDVRDWMGPETRIELMGEGRNPQPGSKGTLLYDDSMKNPRVARKVATFVVGKSDGDGTIHGHDSIVEFELTEEER